MKIVKKLNNNVVLSINSEGKEVVVMGKGLAFDKKKGEEIPSSAIQKIFVVEGTTQQLDISHLLLEMDNSELALAKQIITLAEKRLGYQFSDLQCLMFLDHLHYLLQRLQDGLPLPNPLLTDIKKIYDTEYQVAVEACQLIESKYPLDLSDNEAGFITLHFIKNSNQSNQFGATLESVQIVKDILGIISKNFGILLDERSFHYKRLVTHLNYFVQRVLMKEYFPKGDEFLVTVVKERYPKSFACAKKIGTYLDNAQSYHVSDDELLYLTLHIQRVIAENK